MSIKVGDKVKLRHPFETRDKIFTVERVYTNYFEEKCCEVADENKNRRTYLYSCLEKVKSVNKMKDILKGDLGIAFSVIIFFGIYFGIIYFGNIPLKIEHIEQDKISPDLVPVFVSELRDGECGWLSLKRSRFDHHKMKDNIILAKNRTLWIYANAKTTPPNAICGSLDEPNYCKVYKHDGKYDLYIEKNRISSDWMTRKIEKNDLPITKIIIVKDIDKIDLGDYYEKE